MAESALRERPTSIADYQIAIDVLSYFVEQPESASLRFAFPGIRPLSGESLWPSNARRVRSDADNPPRVQIFRLSGIQGPTVERLITTYVPDRMDPTDAVLEVQGRWPIDAFPRHPAESLDLSSRRRNLSSYTALDGIELFTELPKERIFVTPFSFGRIGRTKDGDVRASMSDFGVHIPLIYSSDESHIC